MTDRYGTFAHGGPFEFGDMATHGVIDSETGAEYVCYSAALATALAKRLNLGQDCRFNCRAQREADYLQGWVDRDRDCPIPEAGKRCAKRYVDGAKSGLQDPVAPEFVRGMDERPRAK